MSFADTVKSQLGSMSRNDADGCDFGVVKVDNDGKILIYNRYEAELAGIPYTAAEGRNFFTEIAPCTNNKLFFGRFKDGVAKGQLDESFNYTFTYKLRPTNVAIQLVHDKASRTNWVFVKRK